MRELALLKLISPMEYTTGVGDWDPAFPFSSMFWMLRAALFYLRTTLPSQTIARESDGVREECGDLFRIGKNWFSENKLQLKE